MRNIFHIFVAFLLSLSFWTVCGSAFAADTPLEKLDWNTWRTIPVYDEGRIMPLNTFSRLLVARICGTTRPYLVLDNVLLEKIETLLAAKYAADADLCKKEAGHIRARLKELFPDGKRQFESYELLFSWIVEPGVWDFVPLIHVRNGEEFRQDILTPSQSGSRQAGTSGVYIAPIQLDLSSGYHDLLDRVQQRQWEAMRKARMESETQETPKVELTAFETTALELHNTLAEFRNLTFVSKKDSTRIKQDEKMNYIDVDLVVENFAASRLPSKNDVSSAFMPAMKNARVSFSAVSRNWNRVEQQGLNHFLPSSRLLPTRSSDSSSISMFEKIRTIALLFTHLNRMTQETPEQNEEKNPNTFSFERAEVLLEAILMMTDEMLKDSEIILAAVYPEQHQTAGGENASGKLDPQGMAGREDAIAFHFSLGLLRRSTQLAYLSLYQSGRTLQVLPALCDEAVRSDHSSGTRLFEFANQSPWVPLNLVLRGGSVAIRRFVDRDYPLPIENTLVDSFPSELVSSLSDPVKELLRKPAEFKEYKTEKNKTTTDTSKQDDQSAASVVDRVVQDVELAIDTRQKLTTNSTRHIRYAYLDFVSAYTGVKIAEIKDAILESDGGSDLTKRVKGSRSFEWNGATIVFAHSLRGSAERMEQVRETLLPAEMSDKEILRKTAYPLKKSLNVEFFYTRLDPFYWMGFTAFISLLCLVPSALLGFWRRFLIARETKTYKKAAEFPQEVQDQKQPGTALILVEQPHPAETSGTYDHGVSPGQSTQSGSKKPMVDLFADRYAEETVQDRFPKIRRCETLLFWSGVVFLILSATIIFIGCALRAYISGWAPVSNMFETIVLMSFFAACLGLWFSLQPLFGPALWRSWRFTAFPWAFFRKIYTNLRYGNFEEILDPSLPVNEQDMLKERYYRDSTTAIQRSPAISPDALPYEGAYFNDFKGIPDEINDARHRTSKFVSDYSSDNFIYLSVAFIRVLLIVFTLGIALFASYHEYSDGQGLLKAIFHSFMMNDPIDWIVVLCSFGAIVWFVPRLILTCVIFPFIFFFSDRQTLETNSEVTTEIASNAPSLWGKILDRKVFVLVGALLVCFAAIATQMNPKEFNPNIRPLAAVLRSNFWLAVHVVAIVVSYAAGLIAWLLALASLGAYTFGAYRKSFDGEKARILPPYFCEKIAPYIRETLKAAAWMLMIGTILGARWADYSWGRFWSWDVKEVWALITLLIILGVLHGRIARFYGEFGVAIGAVLSAIAIVMTWYGFNFVFNIGRHAYGHGDSSWATIFLMSFIVINIIWSAIAILRFSFENSGKTVHSLKTRREI